MLVPGTKVEAQRKRHVNGIGHPNVATLAQVLLRTFEPQFY